MIERIPIKYGEFYDYPRQIRFRFKDKWFYLNSPFDEEKDDYSDFYEVYLLPYRSEEEIRANPHYWMNLRQDHHLGRIGISELGLDDSRRKDIDAHAFAKWFESI